MKKSNEEPDVTATTPAALRPELAARFLSAMRAAAEQEGEGELERRLRRLSPAPLAEAHEAAWLAHMQRAAAPRRVSRRAWAVLYRWGSAAALVALCASGGFLMMNGSAAANEPAGLACRSLQEAHWGDTVQWSEGQGALRPCDVLYEDSFILDGDEGSTITVRVPVRTRVMVEEDVI